MLKLFFFILPLAAAYKLAGPVADQSPLQLISSPTSPWGRARTVREVARKHSNPNILKQVQLDGQVEFDCIVESVSDVTEISIWWTKDGENITQIENKYVIQVSRTSDGVISSTLIVENIEWADSGSFQCKAGDGDATLIEGDLAKLVIHSKPRNSGRESGSGAVNGSLEISCSFQGFPRPNVSWLYQGNPVKENQFKYEITEDYTSNTTVKSLLKILNLSHADNGTYICYGQNSHNSDTAFVSGLVYDVPSVEIDQILPVSSTKLFLNWTVNSWNLPIQEYFLHYREEGENAWSYHQASEINPESTSFLMSNLTANKKYQIKLAAKNDQGTGEFVTFSREVKTLDFDPVFIPEISIKGITKNSISVGWNDPPEQVVSFIQFYKATKRSGETLAEVIHSHPHPLHLWNNLDSAQTYEFTVSACNRYSMECSPVSPVIAGTTYDGKAGPPADVQMSCRSDNISNMNWVDVRWQPPAQPNGIIEFYNVELSGRARFKDENGKTTVISTSPQTKTEDSAGNSTARMTRFDFLDANTNYSVRVCAVTGSKECGGWSSDTCTMGPRPPLEPDLEKFNWIAEEREGKSLFKLPIPKLSGRSGGICCIRVIVVKLKDGESIASLPSDPTKLPLTNYVTVHSENSWGAYIAEVISSIYMGKDVYVGDGKNTAALGLGTCPECHPFGRDIHKRFTNPALDKPSAIEDGLLDPNNNYTAFVEVVIEDGGIGRSPYMISRKPGLNIGSERIEMNTVLVSVLGVLAGLVLVALVLLVVLYTLRRYSKQVANQQGIEMDLKHTFRHLCSTLRGVGHSQFLLTQENFSTPDMPPIDKSGMVTAYLERHKDSDYGFQSEFESLPESYNDRSTQACDSACNKSKNRYPDIKAYDQTRVKLAPVEGVEGSDYINANFVVGYKERKRWICTQGPLISTLEDYWRMIHEQGVEIVIMLTNLEEYNRVKCAQYWPGAGTSSFGGVTVAFVEEKRYSDYVVRDLKMSVEGGKSRHIQHYHYLQWKDFNAPEHAPAMLKFVKRINEAWSGSSPILVHCSAGVGRSGTLIAIDSLIQNLNEEGAVSIYQTVSDLRRQRNYLVQSVKQYQFVYRAIMEYSQFGDTECSASKLKESWVELMQEVDGLNNQFNSLAMVVDDRKALSVATNLENRCKNGSDSIIPYDRNRVILTPDGSRPHSTYINASFIEGYHNDESFIITQDPLEETALDFWRMVVEHNVATMVVLSSEGEFWNYWPEERETREFGYMCVTHTTRENRVAYIKREFTVYNKKTFEEVLLTHFHYTEWPSGEEESVPSSTHGLLGLVEHALAHQEQASLTGPIAVHCRYGSYRSSLYVVLSVLVQQIKKESRCDVFTAIRKLRAQRQGMVQDIHQYEFVYRAISDYVELYMNKEEEYEYSVPVGFISSGTSKSAKSVVSAKSNGSGPYSVPVGTLKSIGSS